MLIHILRNMLTNMLVRRTMLGFVPALLKTNIAIRRAMSYFDNAAAIVNPPSRSIMTGVHMDANAKSVACLGPSRSWGSSSDLIIPSKTTKNGIRSDVTNSGITCNISW